MNPKFFEYERDNGQRFTLVIPGPYDSSISVPLIIVLHYGYAGRMPTPFYGRELLQGVVEPAWQELGAIMAAPDCQHANWANPKSEAAVLELIRHLQKEYQIAADKIVLTGYSLSGMGTWYLAARNQQVFAAAVPMAGSPQPDSADVDWQIPLYILHGQQDELIPFEQTTELVAKLQARQVEITLELLDGVTHYEKCRFMRPLRNILPWLQEKLGIEK